MRLTKIRNSALQLVSFDETTDHLFEAVSHMKFEAGEGGSKHIILGQSMSIGLGALKAILRLMIDLRNLVAERFVF